MTTTEPINAGPGSGRRRAGRRRLVYGAAALTLSLLATGCGNTSHSAGGGSAKVYLSKSEFLVGKHYAAADRSCTQLLGSTASLDKRFHVSGLLQPENGTQAANGLPNGTEPLFRHAQAWCSYWLPHSYSSHAAGASLWFIVRPSIAKAPKHAGAYAEASGSGPQATIYAGSAGKTVKVTKADDAWLASVAKRVTLTPPATTATT